MRLSVIRIVLLSVVNEYHLRRKKKLVNVDPTAMTL